MPFLISVSFSHFKSPHGWRLDLILRARRLECGFYGALTIHLSRYSPERKEAILKKLLPPYPRSISEVAKEEGIPEATLYNWRKALREKGAAVPSKKTSPEQWSAQTKLAVVAETYTMTEHELSTYCRSKGLYPEQIHTWREECLHGFRSSKEKDAEAKQQSRADKLEIKAL